MWYEVNTQYVKMSIDFVSFHLIYFIKLKAKEQPERVNFKIYMCDMKCFTLNVNTYKLCHNLYIVHLLFKWYSNQID